MSLLLQLAGLPRTRSRFPGLSSGLDFRRGDRQSGRQRFWKVWILYLYIVSRRWTPWCLTETLGPKQMVSPILHADDNLTVSRD